MPIILIGGGARSGKSRYALERARREQKTREGSNLVFIATAEALDDEMRARIDYHRSARGPEFRTVEAPLELANAIRDNAAADAIVVDCLTLWLSNTLDRDLLAASDDLEAAARAHPGCVIFVTNEVGCGIVPDNALARDFRDRSGFLNQRLADAASEVYWMIFGQPLRVK